MSSQVDDLGVFSYKRTTISARIFWDLVPEGESFSYQGTWMIFTLKGGWSTYPAFRASPDDTEDEVRERVKHWLDQHPDALPEGDL